MNNTEAVQQRAVEALRSYGADPESAMRIVALLNESGLQLSDAWAAQPQGAAMPPEERPQEPFLVRWVSVNERAVPANADTIIRTITRTVDGRSWITTHWLEGLRGPQV